jgi:hypothetical protein
MIVHKEPTHAVPGDLADAYREMAANESREAEAHEWAEVTIRDIAGEAW